MSNHLDLEEQEQLEQLKAFWGQYGNAITWGLIVIFGVFAAWNGFQYWQRQQAAQASALYDEVERMAASGDAVKTLRAFEEMKNRYPATAYAQDAALLLAQASMQSGKPEEAKVALRWASEQGKDTALAAVARLRLVAVLLELKEYGEAAKLVEVDPVDVEYLSLFQDRRGDVLAAKGDTAAAVESYKKALASASAKPELRRLVRIKLNALGVDVELPVSKSSDAGKAK